MTTMFSANSLHGSLWNRWDPHLHSPGTVLNDNFGEDSFEAYLQRIETDFPLIKALGITDYYSLDTYEKVLEAKRNGRLKDVDLIFPNVELRLKLGTGKNSALNAHLLINPEGEAHIGEARRFLEMFVFSVTDQEFRCSKGDLIRLGKYHDKNILDDGKALEIGTIQFKIDPEKLLKELQQNKWAKQNVLLSIPASSNDGTAGLSADDSFTATRQNIERFADIIFSGNPNDRDFWLGKRAASKTELFEKYNGLKPCIHGSDAHSLERVGKPDHNRFTWIKGDLTFESLRQICIEPEDRVFVGVMPPSNPVESNIIDKLNVYNTTWLSPSDFKLNSGLIAIIGARGSGKTALADMIAAGGYVSILQRNSGSFLRRASDHLQQVSVELDWLSGAKTSRDLLDNEDNLLFESPKVRYLSQQFVDQLCSSEGITDDLLQEIENVILNSHPYNERLGVTNFRELLSEKCASTRERQFELKEAIRDLSHSVSKELLKRYSIPVLKKKLEEKEKELTADKATRGSLVKKGGEERVKGLQDASSALDEISKKLQQWQGKYRALEQLRQSVENARFNTFPSYLRKLKELNPGVMFSDDEWNRFNINYIGDVDEMMNSKLKEAKATIERIKGQQVNEAGHDVNVSFLKSGENLTDQTFELLSQEVGRLRKLVGIDSENGKQYARITEKIGKLEKDMENLKKEVLDCEGAQARITELMKARKEAYQKIFAAILNEENQLRNLYSPLRTNLEEQQGSISKLSFTVQRNVNTQLWASQGEDLLDLRKNGPFKGKGAILEAVDRELKAAWQTGNDVQVAEAISRFRESYNEAILAHAPIERNSTEEYIQWANRVGEWIYSTGHISITYGVSYDGIDIKQLSPGTRGIVLLLLFLAIDKEDDRPLIIDQPEENLDPKSIFDELVPIFRSVKKRRQVIIITHNANLVVNTDADQVIIASVGPHHAGKLPEMRYKSGGLENPEIRKGVCEILEGGEAAFIERAKRLRVKV